MRKNLYMFLTLIIFILVCLNVYIYLNTKSVSNNIQDSNLAKDEIMSLGEFRNYVVSTAHMQKLYLLTGKDEYKNQFNIQIKNVNDRLDNLVSKKYITQEEKTNLMNSIQSYSEINTSILSKSNVGKINSEVEQQIIDANKIQLEILSNISLYMAQSADEISLKNQTALSSNKNQQNSIQIVSGAITLIISIPIYYFKIKLKKDDINIEDIIKYLMNHNEINKSKEAEIIKNATEKINNITLYGDEINTIKQKLFEHTLLLSYANMLYKENIKFKDQWNKSEAILDKIDKCINEIKLKIENYQYDFNSEHIVIEDLEREFKKLKVLYQLLPNYHEFITQISKSMVELDKNK